MVQLVIPFVRGGVPCITPKQIDDLVACSTTPSSDGSTAAATTVFSYSIFDSRAAAKACAKLNVSYAAFCGYKDAAKYQTIMTIRQADIGPHNAGPSTENAVVGDSDAGRVTLDVKLLAKHAAELRPTWCMPIYAPSTIEEMPTKKSRTAASRTAKWFGAAAKAPELAPIVAVPSSIVAGAAEHQEAAGKCPLMFLDDAGQGESLGARTAAMSRMVSSSAASSSAADEEDNAAVKKATFVIADTIPAILMAALAGVDLVECEYAAACARRGQAIDLTPLIAALRGEAVTATAASYAFVMDLNDQKHQLDLSPFSPKGTCPCYSCRRHTKAYVYHLLSVQEMNSETILALHNLSQVMQLCDAINVVRRQVGGEAVAKERIMKALEILGH